MVDTHDSLRLRLERGGDGDWVLRIMPRGTVSAAACLTWVDLAGLDAPARQERTRAEARAAADRLDPQAGKVLQAVCFAGGQEARLLLVIHHLAIDSVSGRTGAGSATAGSRGARPDAGARARRHAVPGLGPVPGRICHNPGRACRTPRLGDRPRRRRHPLIEGAVLDPARDTAACSRRLSMDLPVELTAALLTTVPAAFHARINDVLLAALAVAVAAWKRRRQDPCDGTILVDLEGHGREPMSDGIDLRARRLVHQPVPRRPARGADRPRRGLGRRSGDGQCA